MKLRFDSLQKSIAASRQDLRLSDSLKSKYLIEVKLPLSGRYVINGNEYSGEELEEFLLIKQKEAGVNKKYVWMLLYLDKHFKVQDKPIHDLFQLSGKLGMRMEVLPLRS